MKRSVEPEPPDALVHALEDAATRLRVDCIRATTAAGSGHPSSCASAADLVAAIFLTALRVEPGQPRAPSSDRFVLSKGHAAPLLYAAWAEVGFLQREQLTTLRQLDSDQEGHPTPRLPFVDVATGSLGQGLSVGAGLALGARLAGRDVRAWVLLGDGETAEGSVWEAVELAAHNDLSNVVAVVDVNGLGQSGPTMLGHDVDAYRRRFAAFDWRVRVIDGHDMRAIVKAVRWAQGGRGAPSAIIARTVKGRGIEGRDDWHGKALPPDAAERAIERLQQRLHHLPPPPMPRPRSRAARPIARATVEDRPTAALTGAIATRQAYGDALVRLGAKEPRLIAVDGDVKNSTFADRFRAAYPERFVEAFIAEQNMVSMAAGLAAQGWIPFTSTFACFFTRAADQIRMAGISGSNVKFCGSHAGISIGEDGPSQMGLEDLALFRAVPGAVVLYPADGVATHACVMLAAGHHGPAYLRTTRMATPQLYGDDAAFRVGGLSVLRQSEHDRLTIVAAGITLHETLAAHAELAANGIPVRVIDLYSVKPVDTEGLLAAARATGGTMVTVEDHYLEGGLGDAVQEAVGSVGVRVHRLAVREVPRSGPPLKLLERYGIGRGAIAAAVRGLATGNDERRSAA
jgi:transketolase